MDYEILYDVGEYAEMHPALDVAQGTLHTTVLVNTSKGLVPFLLKSWGADSDSLCQVDGQPYDEWNHAGVALKTQGLDLSYATPQLRWNGGGLRAALNGEPLEVPSFPLVYRAVRGKLAEYLVADERHLTLAALTILLTYYHPLFDKLPILWCYAIQGVGKSRLGELVGYLGFNGMVTSTATRATIFRTADAGRYCQVLTEMDSLTHTQSGDTLATDFHGCTNPGEAWVAVAEQENGKGRHKPVRYYGYSPRILCTTAVIRSKPLLSRCVRLDIRPSGNPDMDKLDRTLRPENKDLYAVRDLLYRLQLGRWTEVRDAYQAAKQEWRGADAPKGRPRDKWMPLYTLATLTGDAEAVETVKELAAKDTREFFQSRGDSLDAYLVLFAWNLAFQNARHPESTRQQIWDDFTRPAKGLDDSHPAKEANWATDFGLSLDIEWLKRGPAGGPQKLINELNRLELIAGFRDKADNRYFSFDKASVLEKVRTALGPEMAQECASQSRLDKDGVLEYGYKPEEEEEEGGCRHLNVSMSGRCLDCDKQVEERKPTPAQRRYLRALRWSDVDIDQMAPRRWKAILDQKEEAVAV